VKTKLQDLARRIGTLIEQIRRIYTDFLLGRVLKNLVSSEIYKSLSKFHD